MKSLFFIIFCVVSPLCGCARFNEGVISGGSGTFLPNGYVAVLTIQPRAAMALAIRYPRPADIGNTAGGTSGNKGADNRSWREERVLSFADQPEEKLAIIWEYSTRTEELVFNETRFDVPISSLAVITLDAAGTPTCEVTTYSPAAVSSIELEFREIADAEAIPAVPADSI